MKIRKSHLMSLKKCPRLFELVWLKKLGPKEAPVSAQFGRQFHEEASSFFEKVDPEKLLAIDNIQEVKNYFASLVSGANVLTPKLREKVVRWTEIEADRWWIACRTEREALKFFFPLYVELHLENDDLNFEATIDRVDWLTDKNTIIIEYKPVARPADVRQELAYYFLGYNYVKPEKATHIGWYLYETGQFHMEVPHQNTIRALRRLISKFNDYVKNNYYPMNVTDNCVNCDFVPKCMEEPEFEKANKKATENLEDATPS